MIATYITCGAALVASNFFYQSMQASPDWLAASERSFFQIVALVCVGLALLLRRIA